MLEICLKYTLGKLDLWFKYGAIVAYLFAFIVSRMNPLSLPVPIIAAGVTLLSMLFPLFNLVFNWGLFSLLVYMLITYHEHDGCILDECHQSETSALITVIATIAAWTTIADQPKPKKVKTVKATPVVEAVPIKLKPREPVRQKTPTFPKLQWV